MNNIIKSLRKRDGYTQKDLSDKLGITRQTLSGYEKGINKIPVPVIQKLSEIFDMPYDAFIEGKMPERYSYNIIDDSKKQEKETMRINIPKKNVDKFKEVLIYILNKVGAKPNIGQTVIYKLLYFIDFDYYELYEEQLIGAEYIKNTHGPTPVDFIKIISEMESNNEISVVKIDNYYGHKQTKYLPNRPADLDCLTAKEIKHIDDILDKYSDKSATELSALSHKDIPWLSTESGKIIDYETVFYRTSETSVRSYDD